MASLSNFSTLAVVVFIVLPEPTSVLWPFTVTPKHAFKYLDAGLVHIEAIQAAFGDHHRCILDCQSQVVVLLDFRDFEDVRAGEQFHARVDQAVGQHLEAGIVAGPQDGAQRQQDFGPSLFGAQDGVLLNLGYLVSDGLTSWSPTITLPMT